MLKQQKENPLFSALEGLFLWQLDLLEGTAIIHGLH